MTKPTIPTGCHVRPGTIVTPTGTAPSIELTIHTNPTQTTTYLLSPEDALNLVSLLYKAIAALNRPPAASP